LEEIPDELDDEVDGLLHLHGEGVAVEPGNDEEKDLVEVKEEQEVVFRSKNSEATPTCNSKKGFQ